MRIGLIAVDGRNSFPIKAVFDESQHRFGANKIAAVLSAQGIPTSAKYVRGLMQEMGLQSITQYSKRDYQKEKQLAKNRMFSNGSFRQMNRIRSGSAM